MDTHGLSGFERFMLGSVTEKVLRKATCSVLVVPPPAMTKKVPYAVALAVDFSEPSLAALRFAFSIAENADAHLTILHVTRHFEIVVDDPPLFDELSNIPAETLRVFV